MGTTHTVRVLVDNSIESLSDVLNCVRKPAIVPGLGQPHTFSVIAFERKRTGASEAWKEAQRERLPTIARLVRERRIEFNTYPELQHEAFKRRSFPANPIGRLFAKLECRHLDAPIDRSNYMSLPAHEYASKARVVHFCKWLLTADLEPLMNSASNPCPPFEAACLKKVSRYRELCRGLSDGQLPDAFHLWTAEVHGLDFFLTADRRFTRAILARRERLLPCPPVSPEGLLETMGVADLDPFPFRHGQAIGLFGQPV
jgi:hypothetical protein